MLYRLEEILSAEDWNVTEPGGLGQFRSLACSGRRSGCLLVRLQAAPVAAGRRRRGGRRQDWPRLQSSARRRQHPPPSKRRPSAMEHRSPGFPHQPIMNSNDSDQNHIRLTTQINSQTDEYGKQSSRHHKINPLGKQKQESMEIGENQTCDHK